MADLAKFAARLRSLFKLKSLPGWILALPTIGRWLYKIVDVSSNLDWLYSLLQSKWITTLWTAVISPTGSFVTMILGIGWIAIVVAKDKPKQLRQGSELPELTSGNTNPESVMVSDSLLECPDKWLHDIADGQVRRVWEFVELLKVSVWKFDLDAHIPTLKWGFVIKNNSVFPISLDGDVRGHLLFEGQKLLEQRTVVTNGVHNLRYLQKGTYTCEQRLSKLEADIINNNTHGKFSFQALQIDFKGGEGFDQIKSRQLLVPDNYEVELGEVSDKESRAVAKAVGPIEKDRKDLRNQLEKLTQATSTPPGNLVINTARYGVPGIYEEDVKPILAAMVKDNALVLKEYYNDFLPDKLKGKVKQLLIDYTHHGIPFSITLPENTRITLPIPYQGVKRGNTPK